MPEDEVDDDMVEQPAYLGQRHRIEHCRIEIQGDESFPQTEPHGSDRSARDWNEKIEDAAEEREPATE